MEIMETTKTYDHLIKLLLIGDISVGKSSIILRFTDDSFATSYISTIGVDFKIKTIEVDNLKLKLQIWDTAGQERYHTITRSFYRHAMGVFIVYDITNIESFESVSTWVRMLDRDANCDIIKILVGNKVDLDERRAVLTDQGKKLANNYNLYFIEVSAQSGSNIEKMYYKMTRLVLKQITGKGSTIRPDDTLYGPVRTLSRKDDKKKFACCHGRRASKSAR